MSKKKELTDLEQTVESYPITPLQQCEMALESKLLPAWVKTPNQALIIMQKSKELGFPPLAGFDVLYTVNNEVALSARGMAALIRQKGGKFMLVKDNLAITDDKGEVIDTITEIIAERKGDNFVLNGVAAYHKVSFKWSDAARMDLTSKSNWKKMPSAMLAARCLSKMARLVFPDYILGMYTPEELGADNYTEEIF